MATIQNKTNRHKDFNLTQRIAKTLGEGFSAQKHVGQLVTNPRTGQVGTTTVAKVIPASIHFNPKEIKYNVAEEILQVPEIKIALEKGDLALVR